MKSTFDLNTDSRSQLIDITDTVSRYVREARIASGVCVIYTPHTTAAITINENADPSVKSDIVRKLQEVFPKDDNYSHLEGNSDAHIKSSLVGCSETVIIADGSLQLGTWQGIMFCEFDGPRRRRFSVQLLADS
jgi:secondary thiamine-phosphate synthase enzyme